MVAQMCTPGHQLTTVLATRNIFLVARRVFMVSQTVLLGTRNIHQPKNRCISGDQKKISDLRPPKNVPSTFNSWKLVSNTLNPWKLALAH